MKYRPIDLTHNILSVYRCATDSEVSDGISWYPRAHAIVTEWADYYSRSIANVACVIAAVSPQIDWDRNLVIAADLLAGNPPSIGGAIHSFVRIAEKVRDDRAGQLRDYFKQGCKVQCFAANLAGDYRFPTVDTHAAQIAAGDPAANLRVDTWKRYEPVSSAYIAAAKLAKIEPAELQAITWLTWKRLYPVARKRVIRRKW